MMFHQKRRDPCAVVLVLLGHRLATFTLLLSSNRMRGNYTTTRAFHLLQIQSTRFYHYKKYHHQRDIPAQTFFVV
ncbi:hypothetical protein BDZ45DRAFT_106685 [Acephala macrosclerotiorum]|nr:hypothetical protein BDZ45DRAFT_106685 [Acephala macrosclerotiorum]